LSTILFDKFESKSPKDPFEKPYLVVSLNYLNSIYTRKRGLGKMNLTISSWTKGPQEALNKTFAKISLLNDKGNLVPEKEWDKNSKGKEKEV
jgi:hypothetical protein